MSYISQLAPLRVAIATAGISTSVFFAGNITNAYFGAVPSVRTLATTLSNNQKAKIWLLFYKRAAPVMAASAITSTISFLTAAYLYDKRLNGENLRNIAILGALSSVGIVVWTFNQMMPVNRQLEAIVEGETAKEPYTDKLIGKWAHKHVVRMVLGSIGYLSAIYLQNTL